MNFNLRQFWTLLDTTGEPPAPSCCHAVAHWPKFEGNATRRENHDLLYLYGGGNINEASDHLYQLNLEEMRWALIQSHNSDIPGPRLNHTALIVNTSRSPRLILFGGQTQIDHTDLAVMDLCSHTWLPRLPFPLPFKICPNDISSSVQSEESEVFSDEEEMLTNNRPRQAATQGQFPNARKSHTAVMYKDRMYVLMGIGTPGPGEGSTTGLNILADFWVLDCSDPDGYAWIILSSNVGRYPCPPHSSIFPADLPGDTGSRNTARIPETNLRSEDPCSESHNFGPPVPVFGHSAVVYDDVMLVFGGMTGPRAYSNRLDEFNFVTGSWREIIYNSLSSAVMAPFRPRTISGLVRHVVETDAIPRPRYAHASWVDSSGLYIHGGDTNACTQYFDDLWHFSFQIKKWQDITFDCLGPRPSKRSGHAAATVDGVVYLIGGELDPLDRQNSSNFVRGHSSRRQAAPQPISSVAYSPSTFQFTSSFSVRAPLRDLCARWLAAAGVTREEDEEDIELMHIAGLSSSEGQPASGVSGARQALMKYQIHPLHRHLPANTKTVAPEGSQYSVPTLASQLNRAEL